MLGWDVIYIYIVVKIGFKIQTIAIIECQKVAVKNKLLSWLDDVKG